MRGSSEFEELLADVAARTGVSRWFARKMADAIFDEIRNEVWNTGSLQIHGFAFFKVKHRAAKDQALNSTGVVPAHRAVTIRASPKWRRRTP